MSAFSVRPTFPFFTDVDGSALEAGYVYIGEAGSDPQTVPLAVYWDAALSIPATQPIRTIGGYPSRSGTPARLYTGEDYSIRVLDRRAQIVYTDLTGTSFFDQIINAADVTYDPASGSSTTVQAALRALDAKVSDWVSVVDFGATGDGVTDDTSAIQAAIDWAETQSGQAALDGQSGYGIFFPDGNYKITSGLTVEQGGIGLFGTPSKGARIFSSVTNIAILTIGNGVNNIWGCHVHNLLFEHSEVDATTTIGIKLNRTFGGTINNCTLLNFYDGILGIRGNRFVISNVKTFQNRTTNIAKSSIRVQGDATGTGGGYHITDCEFAGGGTLIPSVIGHITIEECDGMYVENTHTRDCRYGVYISPDGTTGKNNIDSLFFSNCYFDNNFASNVEIGGTVDTGGRYQQIHFTNCYFRGCNESTNCIEISVADAGGFVSGGRYLEAITVTGGSIRQGVNRGVLVSGSSTGKLNVHGLRFSGVDFRDHNYGNTASLSGTAMSVCAESLSVTDCVFGADAHPGDTAISAILNSGGAGNPGFICTGNDFSLSNCDNNDPITRSSQNYSPVVIADNVFPSLGRMIDQTYHLETADATTTDIWLYPVPAEQTSGYCEVYLSGHNVGSGHSVVYSWTAGFRRDGSALTLSTGTANFAAGIAWNPDGIATPPTATRYGYNLRVQVTGVGTQQWKWSCHVKLITSM